MIARLFTPLLQEYLKTFPVVAVVGSRQVGKSTLVRQPGVCANRLYVALDDFGSLSVAQSDPKGFLSMDGPLTVDEVQMAPVLLREIKRLVDEDRRPGRFLLTGSADLDHCADISSVLAGRVGVLRLPPITIAEEHVARGWRSWLASHLCGISSLDALRADPRMLGRLFETLVMMEVQALLPLAPEPAQLFHVRTHDGLEVDGLVALGRRHLPFEIKASQTVTASDAGPIERWIALNPGHGPGIVIHAGKDYLALSKNVRAVPAAALFCH